MDAPKIGADSARDLSLAFMLGFAVAGVLALCWIAGLNSFCGGA